MSRRAKVGFFFLSVFVMGGLAAGSILMSTDIGAGLAVVFCAMAAAAGGFVAKRRISRRNAEQ